MAVTIALRAVVLSRKSDVCVDSEFHFNLLPRNILWLCDINQLHWLGLLDVTGGLAQPAPNISVRRFHAGEAMGMDSCLAHACTCKVLKLCTIIIRVGHHQHGPPSAFPLPCADGA